MYVFMKILLWMGVIAAASTEPSDVICCKDGGTVDGGVCVKDNETVTPINLSCGEYVQIPGLNFEITEDGTLFVFLDVELRQEKGSYCVVNGTSNSTGRDIVFCDDSNTEKEIIDDRVLAYCMIITSIFLILTALVYCILSEIRDLLGKSIINMCACLGIAQCIMVGMKLAEYSDMGLCAARGFFAYYFFLAAFFWANAIAIQLLINMRQPTKADYGWKHFLLYALYANGVPAVLTVGMAIVNFLPGRHMKPGIGLNHCWFISTAQKWYYMYSVMSILLVINIGIFIFILVQLWSASFSSSSIKALRYKFLLTFRLIIVMGLTWIFEVISSLGSKSVIWVALDIFNSLQGVLIFFILVVFRKKVVKAMYNRGYLDCISGAVERHLALGDDEEDFVQHTKDLPLDEKLPL